MEDKEEEERVKRLMSLYDNVPVSRLYFESFSHLLEDLVYKGFGMQDKDLRNEMFLLVLMLAKCKENRVAIVESKLLDIIFLVATQPEVLRTVSFWGKSRPRTEGPRQDVGVPSMCTRYYL